MPYLYGWYGIGLPPCCHIYAVLNIYRDDKALLRDAIPRFILAQGRGGAADDDG